MAALRVRILHRKTPSNATYRRGTAAVTIANRSGRSLLLLAATVATGVMTVVTVWSAAWIEVVFGVDPDGGSGELEWVIVGVLGISTMLLARATRATWRAADAARAKAV